MWKMCVNDREHQTDTDEDLHLSSRFQNGDSENDQAVSRITVGMRFSF